MSSHTESATDLLEKAGVKPTSNRLLVVRELINASSPVSLIELEDRLETLERSTIFRALTLFLEHHIVHTFEDGRGITKYEICTGDDHGSVGDLHPHFYCEKCQRVYCFDEVAIPPVPTPPGFRVTSANYMLKGVCPDCS